MKQNGQRADRGGDKKSNRHRGGLISPPTLKELGVEDHYARRCEIIDDLPEETFEQHIAEVKASNAELTTASVLRLAQRLKRNNHHERLEAGAGP